METTVGDRPIGQEGGAANHDRAPADHPPNPKPRLARESVDGGQQHELLLRPRRDRRRDRVLGGVLDRAGQAQHLGLVDPRRRMHGDDGHLAAGHRPGLVEDDGVDLPGRLQHLRPLDQQPQLGAAPGPDQQRRRRRQAERAGAGDDQDRDRSGEGEARPRSVAKPEAESANGEGDHHRHEDAADPVGEALHRRLARLGLGDQAGDLRQCGLFADPGRPDHKAAAGVDRRADHLVARTDLDRDRLAGDQRPVNRRSTALDDAVGRDLLARADDEAVAGGELLDRDLALAAIGVEQGDVLGAEVEQRLQRRPGPPLGPRLEVAPGENEGGDDGGDLEVDLVAAGAALGDQLEGHLHPRHPGVAKEERVERPGERGQGAERDQRVHRRRAVLEVLPGGLVEGPTGPEHDRHRQLQREPLPVVELQRLDHRHRQHR